MQLAIDGYNLLHAIPEFAQAEAQGQGREALLLALRRYRDKAKVKLTVVFDGGGQPEPRRGKENGLPVVYSGGDLTADDIIAKLARRHGPGLVVVTDDRELAGRCSGAGSEVMPSWEFGARLVEEALGMEGVEPGADEGWDFTTKKKGPAKRLPKKQRRRRNRLGKL